MSGLGLVLDDLDVLLAGQEVRLGVEHVDLLVVELVLEDAGVQLDEQLALLDPRPLRHDVGDRRAALVDLALEHDLLAWLDRARLGHADGQRPPLHLGDRTVVTLLGALAEGPPGRCGREGEADEQRGPDPLRPEPLGGARPSGS